MRQIADYVFTQDLGGGTIGRLFRAAAPPRLETRDAWVAVKVVDQPADDDVFARFSEELRAFAAVESPFLVPVLDAGRHEETLFYTTPFFELGSLERPSELTSAARARAVADAARGAHALHEAGLAHHDIKPSNILLADKVDGGVHGLLADIGLAPVLRPGQTVTGDAPIGSLEYMSPGEVRGEYVGRAADIWALGATLYKVLTGRSIFGTLPTGDVQAALRHILEVEPDIDPDLDSAYRGIVERALARAPEERHATAAEVADELESAAT